MAILKIKNEYGEFVNIPSIKGEKGDGIPEGGTEGQVLRKTTDSTEWVELKTSDLTNDSNFATSDSIPTKLSELTNDTSFLTSETDPTVPTHVKGITKEDITNWNNKAEKSDIPDVNDMNTITVDNIKCKNLLCITNVGNAPYGSYDSSTNKITLSTDHNHTTFIIGFKPLILKAGQPYTVTIFMDKLSTTSNGSLEMRFDNQNHEVVKQIHFDILNGLLVQSTTFTLEEDLDVGRIGFYQGNAGVTFKVQMEEGETRTNYYIPYKKFGLSSNEDYITSSDLDEYNLNLGREKYERYITPENNPKELTFNGTTFDNLANFYIIMVATRGTAHGGFKRYLRKADKKLVLLDDVNPTSTNCPILYVEENKVYLKMVGTTTQNYTVGVTIERL